MFTKRSNSRPVCNFSDNDATQHAGAHSNAHSSVDAAARQTPCSSQAPRDSVGDQEPPRTARALNPPALSPLPTTPTKKLMAHASVGSSEKVEDVQ